MKIICEFCECVLLEEFTYYEIKLRKKNFDSEYDYWKCDYHNGHVCNTCFNSILKNLLNFKKEE